MHHGTSFPSDYHKSIKIHDYNGNILTKIKDPAGMSIQDVTSVCQDIITADEIKLWQQYFHLEDEWRRSDEALQLFESAEKRDDTDWIDCVKPKQLQMARQIGFEGSDEEIFKKMTKMAHIVEKPPLCVKYNRAGPCKTDTGEAVAEINLVKQSDMSETTLQQLAEQSDKKAVVVAAEVVSP